MLVEVLLQLLVGVVDAELRKAVGLEALEAVDVENANEGRLARSGQLAHAHATTSAPTAASQTKVGRDLCRCTVSQRGSGGGAKGKAATEDEPDDELFDVDAEESS